MLTSFNSSPSSTATSPSNDHDSTMDTNRPIADKKRARPKDDTTRARKKVASELMAFEFESLSLSSSNSYGGSTNRVDFDDATDSPSSPQRHPSVQRQVAHSLQENQTQRDQELVHSISLHSQNIQHHQQLHQQHQLRQQQQQEQLLQLQSHPHRNRAMSSPIAPGRAVHGKSTGSRPVESNQSAAGSSSSSSSSSASSSSRPSDQQTGRLQQHSTMQLGSLSQSSYSPLSPPISPSPLPPPTTMDISMAMDEGTTEIPKKAPTVQHSVAVGSTNNSSSQSKVLNLRQRKWNSVSKEWQEWHDVQATHAPDLPSPLSQQPQSQPQPPAANAISRTSATEVAVLGHLTNVHTSSGTGAESVTDMQRRTSSLQQINSGSPSNHHHDNQHQGKEGSLGRQRSLHESRDKYNGGHTQEDPRTTFGSRARSFSETNIYPYTQYQDFQQQQQQQQQGQGHQNHQQQQQVVHQQLIQLSTPSSQFPSQQWNNNVSGAAGQLYPHPCHDPHIQQPVQDTVHPGHPPRHHSDHLYPHHGDAWADHGAIDNASSRLGHSPRLRHSVSGSSSSARPQSPWMDLTMTALDGSVNAPNDRFLRHASNTNSTTGGGSPGSSSHGHGQRLEEMSSWNQHLHKSQSGYRESLGITRHGGYGRSSPVQYGQHNLHHQHHSQEDVSMGEEAVRLMPSRSSSPSPCLSMAPTITRPLSISFSHLTGANMLADLAEHECDEDMEL